MLIITEDMLSSMVLIVIKDYVVIDGVGGDDVVTDDAGYAVLQVTLSLLIIKEYVVTDVVDSKNDGL